MKIRFHEFACSLNHKNLTHKIYYTYAIKNLNTLYASTYTYMYTYVDVRTYVCTYTYVDVRT